MITKKIKLLTLFAGILIPMLSIAQGGGNARTSGKIQALPRDLEIQLALSALPPHLRDSATVYVLNPDQGFEVARQGNGKFHAFVARTGDDAMRGNWPLKEYRDDILYPVSFDQAGAKAQMRVFFDIAEMQAKGTAPEELKKLIQDRFRSGYYKAPDRAGISYMLAPVLRTYTSPDENENVATACVPHVMYYAPYVTSEDVGGAKPGSMYPFVILSGPHGYNIQFLGKQEREAIRKENRELLEKLGAINKAWCLPPASEQADPASHHHHHP